MDRDNITAMVDRRGKQIILAVLALFALTILIGIYAIYPHSTGGRQTTSAIEYPATKIVRYSYLLKNNTNEVVENAVFKTYAPVEVTSSQKVKKIDATYDYSMEKDQIGNQVMTFNLESIPPYGSKVITVTAEMELASKPNTVNERKLTEYLRSEKFIELENKSIKDLSSRLGNVKNIPVSQTVYNWVSRNLSDAGYIQRDRGAAYALKEKRGDCTEYMYLAVALLRNNNIPARGVAGFVVSSNGVLDADEYHNWAEYYQDSRWHILDAQKKVFDKNYEDYIAFRIFGDKGRNMMSQSQRFFASDPRLIVRMN